MSIYGITKGTEMESLVTAAMQGEITGTMLYYAMARVAREEGLEDVAKKFIAAANQEAVHAGFYATLNGVVPKDFWQLLPALKKAEFDGDSQVVAIAEKIRALNVDSESKETAAKELEIFAKQEHHHGELIQQILNEHKPELKDVESDPSELMKVLTGNK